MNMQPDGNLPRLVARDRIREALDDLHAHRINLLSYDSGDHYVTAELYRLNGRLAIVLSTYAGREGHSRLAGVDLFLPATESPLVDQTLEALQRWARRT